MDTLLLFAIAPSFFVGKYFLDNKVGPREPKKEVERSIAFGALAIILTLIFAAIVDALFIGGIGSLSEAASGGDGQLFLTVITHATIEEFAKFIPLAVFIYHKDFFNENSDGIIYFALVGLTFGAIETFLYSLSPGGLIVTVSRYVIALFFHAALTSLVGYFLAMSKIYHRSMVPVIIALLAASIVHALYNFALTATGFGQYFWLLSFAIALLVNSFMFWEFYVASEHDKILIFNRSSSNQPQQ